MYNGKQISEKYFTPFLLEVAFGKKIVIKAGKVSTSDVNFGDCPPLDMLVNI